MDADGVSAMGFAFDSVNTRVTYASPGGHVELAVTQANERQYSAEGDYDFYRDRKELRLADMRFRFDTALWMMPHPGAVRWGGPGVQVDNSSFESRQRAECTRTDCCRRGRGRFPADVDNFPVANIADSRRPTST